MPACLEDNWSFGDLSLGLMGSASTDCVVYDPAFRAIYGASGLLCLYMVFRTSARLRGMWLTGRTCLHILTRPKEVFPVLCLVHALCGLVAWGVLKCALLVKQTDRHPLASSGALFTTESRTCAFRLTGRHGCVRTHTGYCPRGRDAEHLVRPDRLDLSLSAPRSVRPIDRLVAIGGPSSK